MPDSVSDTWNCTRLTYGGNSFYTYTRGTTANKKTSITLSMTYKNLFDKLEQEVKGMNLKEEDGIYQNEKYLIYLQKMEKDGGYTYTVEVQKR